MILCTASDVSSIPSMRRVVVAAAAVDLVAVVASIQLVCMPMNHYWARGRKIRLQPMRIVWALAVVA